MRLTRTNIRNSLRSLALLGDEDFNPVFVCGVAGCGNTVTAALLHERFQVAGFADESALYALERSPFAMRSSQSFSSIAAFRAAMEIDQSIPAARLRQALAAQYRRETELPKVGSVIVDKAPNTHMVRTRQLHAAYPNARFVLIFRDPLSHIEGMRRKWRLFAEAPLADVCGFWKELHECFLADIEGFRDQVLGFSYEEFVGSTDECCERLGRCLSLQPRRDLKERSDRANAPGYALRNVVGGKVHIVKDANTAAIGRLTPEGRESITVALMPLYERLCREFAWRSATPE